MKTQAATLATNKQQVEDGLKQVEEGEAQLADGEQQLEAAQAELDEQRAKADEEFAKQQQTIDDIADARWYVQDRSSVGGYSSLDSDVSSIETLGFAFPVVFLLVAVLMSLTSMTRMVEEERGLIGTYTGLGYGSLTIASRYLLFAALACLIGGGIGLLVGFLGIPAFLLTVLENMYVIPGIVPRIRLAVRQPGHRAVRRRRADGHGRGVPGRTAADAGPAHASEGAKGRLARTARTHQAGVEAAELPQQGHRAQHLPLQEPPDHDRRRRGRMHRAHRLRIRDQRFGRYARAQAV